MEFTKKEKGNILREGKGISRREFLKAGAGLALGTAASSMISGREAWGQTSPLVPQLFDSSVKPVVSVARIKNDQIAYAVEEALDLLGGLGHITKGKQRIMLKPNLMNQDPSYTTNPEVVKALAHLMKKMGKEVLIGEGSAAAQGFNAKGTVIFRTKNPEILDPMQKFVFEKLGYANLAKLLDIPLVNLHCGEMVEVPVPNAYIFDRITLNRSLSEIDLLCSVPMMKTHVLSTVSLGMKNLMGVYPGSVYYAVRAWLHDQAHAKGSPGIAYEIVDAVRANKLGLTVLDASWAVEGQGPGFPGKRIKMDLIVAGTNPLAADMVAARIMGFEPSEIPTFAVAHKAGMKPASIDEIEVRGAKISEVKKDLLKPRTSAWSGISTVWGAKEIL